MITEVNSLKCFGKRPVSIHALAKARITLVLVGMINVIKLRAAYRPELSSAEVQQRYQTIEVQPADITLDFILDERSRELAGEYSRWPDLAARGKLIDRVPTRNPDAANIQGIHRLRPIPQSQLDRISDPDKQKYQNDGY